MMGKCKRCMSEFRGKSIPKEDQEFYGGTHFSRIIGIDGGRADIYDGLVAYKCPDCDLEFPVDDSEWAKDLFNKYIKWRCE